MKKLFRNKKYLSIYSNKLFVQLSIYSICDRHGKIFYSIYRLKYKWFKYLLLIGSAMLGTTNAYDLS